MTSKRALLVLFRTNFKAANSTAFSLWQIGVGRRGVEQPQIYADTVLKFSIN